MMEVKHVAYTRLDRTKADGEVVKVKAWCGRPLSRGVPLWCFQDVNHVVLSLEAGDAITPCRACLKKIKAIIDKELGP